MSCAHPKVSGRARLICAHPGCVNGFGGSSLVTIEAMPIVASAADFGRIYIGPDGLPVHGLRGCVRRTYPRILDVDGWKFGEPTVEEQPTVSAAERCRVAWEQHERLAMGTDE